MGEAVPYFGEWGEQLGERPKSGGFGEQAKGREGLRKGQTQPWAPPQAPGPLGTVYRGSWKTAQQSDPAPGSRASPQRRSWRGSIVFPPKGDTGLRVSSIHIWHLHTAHLQLPATDHVAAFSFIFSFSLCLFLNSVVLFPICCVFNHLRKFPVCIRELFQPSPLRHFLGGGRDE